MKEQTLWLAIFQGRGETDDPLDISCFSIANFLRGFMNRLFSLFAFCALSIASTVAIAHEYKQGHVSIDHPWSRPTPPGTSMGVGYLSITNNSDHDITLAGASTPRAGKVTIHESTMNDGMMSMKALKDGLVIPAGETVELKPHGYHLMLEGLTGRLKQDERVPLALDFDGADSMDVELSVENMGDMDEEQPEETHEHMH